MLTYEMIINAQKGDPYAMQQILSNYRFNRERECDKIER